MVRAIAEATFDLAPGRCLAILGPNGAGKTTLLRLAAGLLAPDEGDIRSDATPPGIRWVAPADLGLHGRLSPRAFLAWYAALDELSDPPVEALLVRFGLADVDRPIRTLSAGVRARIVLARALLAPGRLYLLDEPTRSLDRAARVAARAELAAAARDAATLLVTHDVEEARALATDWRALESGRLGPARPIETLA